jgi:hypothetical protein
MEEGLVGLMHMTWKRLSFGQRELENLWTGPTARDNNVPRSYTHQRTENSSIEC